ncbi:hypothetical protein NMM52_21975, partial [Acinetobacter baumannii]|nr:hypothetical protein [Acinetobacter baumannii]
VELLLWGVEGGGLGCHVWRSFRLVSSGAACVVEDVSSVRRAFSLTYVLTYGKTYVRPYALAYVKAYGRRVSAVYGLCAALMRALGVADTRPAGPKTPRLLGR